MWLIIRKPIANISFSRAQAMCWAEMSASVQWVATRTAAAPRSSAASSMWIVPIPGSSNTAISAFSVAATAASTRSRSAAAANPYW